MTNRTSKDNDYQTIINGVWGGGEESGEGGGRYLIAEA